MVHDGMFQALVENSNDIVIVTDGEFKVRYVSSSVEKLFGIEPFKVIGNSIFNFVDPERRTHWEARLRQLNHERMRDEISLQLVGDRFNYFDIEVSRYFGNSGGGWVLRLHDITEKKSKEKELLKSNRQLDQVIYKTTHDLKAPLRSALGLVDLAQNATEDERQRYLELVRKSLLKLDAYIEEMNDFFRNDKLAIQREVIDIQDLLEQEVEDHRTMIAENKVEIRTNISASSQLYSDSIRLRTIVTNLLSNAIKYRDSRKTRSFIEVNVHIDREICDIRFVDNGIGIEPQYRDKIFDLFFRATEQSQGTGLGLFIVKDTVEKLKGTIDVDSAAGQGATFTIRVPNQILQPISVD